MLLLALDNSQGRNLGELLLGVLLLLGKGGWLLLFRLSNLNGIGVLLGSDLKRVASRVSDLHIDLLRLDDGLGGDIVECGLGEVNLAGLLAELLLEGLSHTEFPIKLFGGIEPLDGSGLGVDQSLGEIDLRGSLLDKCLGDVGVRLMLTNQLGLEVASLLGLIGGELLRGLLGHLAGGFLRGSILLGDHALLGLFLGLGKCGDLFLLGGILTFLGLQLRLGGLLKLLKGLLLILDGV